LQSSCHSSMSAGVRDMYDYQRSVSSSCTYINPFVKFCKEVCKGGLAERGPSGSSNRSTIAETRDRSDEGHQVSALRNTASLPLQYEHWALHL
jgi:hypothetical protein